MQIQLTKNISVKAEYYETRYSWGHKAWLYKDNEEIAYRKITYYNRTWESYQFESILTSLYNKAKDKKLISNYALKKFKQALNNGGKLEAKRVKEQFKSVAMVAKLGDFLTDNQKENNDWKARMLKAGITGLNMPDDWESLDETEKQTRLDKVIKEMEG